MDHSTTTDKLLSQIYQINRSEYDGIQLMWPLPEHIDSSRVYNAIDVSRDVDGIHYVGQCEIGNEQAFPPVTSAATLEFMTHHNVCVKGKRVLVIGRSPIVGSPIAQMMRNQGAATTIVHTDVPRELLETLVGNSDVIISCAGRPGLVLAEWIKGAEVINVGTTFCDETDSLQSDVQGDIDAYASRCSPVPGGIGPLSTPMLLRNTVQAAWNHMDTHRSVDTGWERSPAKLTKKVA